MVSKTDFLTRVSKLKKFKSKTGKASYSRLSVNENIFSFMRDNTEKFWKLDLQELYTAYTKENYFNTNVLKKHLTGRVFSPSLGLLIATALIDSEGFRNPK